jgi:cation diffusion facilitator CzcD-associated flavoprotein CzcO
LDRILSEHVDVLIVGAGLSGIDAACHIKKKCPNRDFVILEARAASGGTWDLFRYPGIRSDSDMFTLGYAFKPWTGDRSIADGPSILNYIRETSAENHIDEHIRFDHRVTKTNWNGSCWEVTAETSDGITTLSCDFLLVCSGYYNYEEPYRPAFTGEEDFKGQIVHPQHWPEALDYKDQQVLVIGSGATAVTLVPEMSHSARHVTMLQRSPTYVVSMPGEDALAIKLRRIFSSKVAYTLTRWKNVIFGLIFFTLSRKRPEKIKQWIIQGIREQLGKDYDVKKHFTPSYNPWDQRVCLVPDADLFVAIRNGKVSVVTDEITRFTENGVLLASGEELSADLIVTATGLSLQVLGSIEVSVDGEALDLANAMTYKGMMLGNVPNLAFVMGYTNASWTLKADLTSGYVCRLLNYMQRHHYKSCCPRPNDPSVQPEPILDFTSGYVQRSVAAFPKQGSKKPWKLHQNYFLDLASLGYGAVTDAAMEFRS